MSSGFVVGGGGALPPDVVISNSLAVGPTPAHAGVIRIPSTGVIEARSASNTADVPVLQTNALDKIILGAGGYDCLFGGVIQVFGTFLSVGSTPATAGAVRINNNSALTARNAANGADVWVIGLDGFDRVVIGQAPVSDIQFGIPILAVGATTLLTLGKTGGSGPANPAQNGWQRWLDASGNPFFVPVWR